jgi:hypothetical protein
MRERQKVRTLAVLRKSTRFVHAATRGRRYHYVVAECEFPYHYAEKSERIEDILWHGQNASSSRHAFRGRKCDLSLLKTQVGGGTWELIAGAIESMLDTCIIQDEFEACHMHHRAPAEPCGTCKKVGRHPQLAENSNRSNHGAGVVCDDRQPCRQSWTVAPWKVLRFAGRIYESMKQATWHRMVCLANDEMVCGGSGAVARASNRKLRHGCAWYICAGQGTSCGPRCCLSVGESNMLDTGRWGAVHTMDAHADGRCNSSRVSGQCSLLFPLLSSYICHPFCCHLSCTH